MLPKNFSFVDIETTGISILRDRIIEIGILRVEDGKLVSTFNSLINPHIFVSPFIENMTGISAKELEDAPTFYSLKKDIYDFLKDSIFIAHNSRFDYAFIKNEFKRCELSFSAKNLCTVKLSRFLYPRYKRHNLDSIIERFNIVCKNRHRALDDAKVLWDFWQIIKTQVSEEKLKKAYNLVTKRTASPINIKQNVLDNLPESSGVYIFYGKDDDPLYIGKSINIKERVLSHFANDHSSSLEMKISQSIESIEVIETAGELGALFKESQLIKKMQPLYNRKLRIKKNLVILKEVINKEGFKTVEITYTHSRHSGESRIAGRLQNLEARGFWAGQNDKHADIGKIDVTELESILGIFKSKKQATDYLKFIAKEYNLCERILGVEKTKRACFGYHLGICNGACTGMEKPIKYNLRFIEAFYKDKIKPWPFKGPVLIREENNLDDKSEAFLIDKWCLLGSFHGNLEDINSIEFNSYEFDQDTYKILVQFISNNKNKNKISNLSVQISEHVSKAISSFQRCG